MKRSWTDEEAALWRISRAKANLTEIRTKLLKSPIKDHPDVIKVLKLIELERQKLNDLSTF